MSWCVIALGWDEGELAGSMLIPPSSHSTERIWNRLLRCHSRAQGTVTEQRGWGISGSILTFPNKTS